MTSQAHPSGRIARGAAVIAAGLAVTGLGTIVMMALSARSAQPREYATFVTWWAVATFFGTAFGVFEAYLTRLIAVDVAGGRDTTALTAAMAGRTWLVAAALGLAVLVASPWLASLLFRGNLGPALVLPLFIVIAATQALQRGVATGYRHYGAIAGQLSTDGLLRAIFSGFLVVDSKPNAVSLALATCAASGGSLIVGDRLCPQWRARPRLRITGVSWGPIGLLLAAAVGPLFMNNGPVPWLAGTRSVGAVTLSAFAGAFTLSQVPTQFVSAGFGPLLAQLTHARELGDLSSYSRIRRRADILALLIGGAFVVVFAVIGPFALSVYLGPRYHLAVSNMVLLAGASGLMLLIVVQQAGLAATGKWTSIGVSWIIGTFALVCSLALPIPPLLRAALAPTVAAAVALLLMLLAEHGQTIPFPGIARMAPFSGRRPLSHKES